MIINLEEKKGALRTLSNEDQTFKSTLSNCALVYLLPSSGFFTWNNQISKCLDQFLSMDKILGSSGIM